MHAILGRNRKVGRSMRWVGLIILIAVIAAGSPIAVTFTGTASGVASGLAPGSPQLSFSDALFTLVFTGDTASLLPAGSEGLLAGAILLRVSSSSELMIAGISEPFDQPGSCLLCSTALFVDSSNGTAGLAVISDFAPFAPFPILTISNPAFTTWDLATSLGPITIDQAVGPLNLGATTAAEPSVTGSFFNSLVDFSSLSIDTFQATAGQPNGGGVSTVPEPSTAALLALGIVGTVAVRRRSSSAL